MAAGFLKNRGKFAPINKTNTETETTDNNTSTEETTTKVSPFAKKKLGTLNKKIIKDKEETKEETIDNTETEVKEKEKVTPSIKPSLNSKKKLGIKKEVETKEVKDENTDDTNKIADEEKTINNEETTEKEIEETEVTKEEPNEPTPVKKQTRKRSSKKTTSTTSTVQAPEIDESKRVTLEEAEALMRPIVAPTTEAWEQEKKDVNEALGKIKVKQDMTVDEIKHALAELDDFNFEVLMKQQDAETMYTGTKQNYEAVKAFAIANASSSNSDGRKAEAILACQNYSTPTGEIINLNEYMLLIEERYKFYQKIIQCIDFKKYSLLNYNNALRIAANN